jgi:nitroreductase
MARSAETATDRVRPLIRVRQVREFRDESVDVAALAAIAEVGRWSGSSKNGQPWRFIVIRDESTLRQLAQVGMPQTRSLQTAPAAIAIALRNQPSSELADAYDEGRAAERMLIAASMLDLGAGICWVRSDVRAAANGMLGLPEDRLVRTILAVGHPTTAARRPKSAAGTARLPRERIVFEERWPQS